jgi:hypothetical protein
MTFFLRKLKLRNLRASHLSIKLFPVRVTVNFQYFQERKILFSKSTKNQNRDPPRSRVSILVFRRGVSRRGVSILVSGPNTSKIIKKRRFDNYHFLMYFDVVFLMYLTTTNIRKGGSRFSFPETKINKQNRCVFDHRRQVGGLLTGV